MESPNRWFITAVCVVIVAAAAGFAYFGSLEFQSCVAESNHTCSTPDHLTIVSAWVNSPTSITIELSHTGLDNLSLSSYYIRDPAGNLYSAPAWTSPTIPAHTNMNVTLTSDGKDLAFQPGNSYQVTLRTSQGYIETFTVTT